MKIRSLWSACGFLLGRISAVFLKFNWDVAFRPEKMQQLLAATFSKAPVSLSWWGDGGAIPFAEDAIAIVLERPSTCI